MIWDRCFQICGGTRRNLFVRLLFAYVKYKQVLVNVFPFSMYTYFLISINSHSVHTIHMIFVCEGSLARAHTAHQNEIARNIKQKAKWKETQRRRVKNSERKRERQREAGCYVVIWVLAVSERVVFISWANPRAMLMIVHFSCALGIYLFAEL